MTFETQERTFANVEGPVYRPGGAAPLPNPPPRRGQGEGPFRISWAVFLASLLVASASVFAACASAARTPEAGPARGLEKLQGTPGKLTAALPASDLAVGRNQRFLLALIGPDNRPVTDASVELEFFKVTGPGQAQLRARAPAVFRESPGLASVARGVYIARTDFDEPGDWGVAAQVTPPGEASTMLRLAFQVKPRSATPAVGDPVPASATLTGQTPQEIERFSSARPVDVSLYRVSIADALAERKPLVVLFATPGFCTSRTCGPSLEVLQELRADYGGSANFVHVEIYKDGRPNDKMEMVPAVAQWGLPSEPWLFVVGADGRLADKFEGSITVEEVRPSLERVLGG